MCSTSGKEFFRNQEYGMCFFCCLEAFSLSSFLFFLSFVQTLSVSILWFQHNIYDLESPATEWSTLDLYFPDCYSSNIITNAVIGTAIFLASGMHRFIEFAHFCKRITFLFLIFLLQKLNFLF
jgi:hypothetical protein